MPKQYPGKESETPENRGAVIPLAKLDDPTSLTALNFRVTTKFHHEFKLYAVQRGLSMVELLQDAFHLYRQHHGSGER